MIPTHLSASSTRRGMSLAVLLLFSCVLTSSSNAQVWKPRQATKIELAGGGTDPSKKITLQAPSLTSSSTITLPDTNAPGLLTNNGSGELAWSTLSSCVLDTGQANSITTTSTSDVVASGMDLVTSGGDYIVRFTSSVDINTNTAGLGTTVSIYAAGIQVASSIITSEAQSAANRTEPISTIAFVKGLSNGDHIDVRWHTSSGKISSMFQRTLIAMKVK